MLKIYSLDFSHYGGGVVVAKSREEAYDALMKMYGSREHYTVNDIQEHDIVDGLTIEFMGDA